MIDIHNYLPHKYPMLMVDHVLSISEKGVESSFEIKEDNVFLEKSLFSEAGLIENAAQTCSCIVAQTFFLDGSHPDLIGFISSIRKIKIFNKPKQGSTIITRSVLLSRYDAENYTTCRMECRTFDGETLLLEGEINLFIQEM